MDHDETPDPILDVSDIVKAMRPSHAMDRSPIKGERRLIAIERARRVEIYARRVEEGKPLFPDPSDGDYPLLRPVYPEALTRRDVVEEVEISSQKPPCQTDGPGVR